MSLTYIISDNLGATEGESSYSVHLSILSSQSCCNEGHQMKSYFYPYFLEEVVEIDLLHHFLDYKKHLAVE